MKRFFTTLWSRLLRDYFAAQALTGITACGSPNEADADLAYRIADAMLAARKDPKDSQDKPSQAFIAPF